MAEKRRDVIFRRIRGRIVPIRRKNEDAKAALKLGAAGIIGSLAASFSSKQLKQSTKIFNKAALIRGARKLSQPGSQTSRMLAKKAVLTSRKAAFKIGKSKFGIFGGALAASIFTTSAVGDFLKPRVSEETKEAFQTISSIGAALGTVALFGRKAKLRGFKSSLKASVISGSPDEQVGILFGKFSTTGRSKTARLIQKFIAARAKPNLFKPKL